MPISRDEYEIGEIDISLWVVQFLRERPDYAFTVDELSNALASSWRPSQGDELVRALEDLVESKRIECKNIKGIMYYRYYKRPLGFVPR